MRCENQDLPPKSRVFWAMCELSCNHYGIDVITTKNIMNSTKLSKYMALKQLRLWREHGFIERASMGCPAQYSGGEYDEMICEAYPPINGWRLTKKGCESGTYKTAQKEYLDGLLKWANGDYDDKGGDKNER